ncbi:MAG TPA: hypothetical protein VNO54_06745 [Streptosporangiaceae bacterium]|nr:hypothetical protein [Streptosporangiaceae bacterium]
MHRYAGSGYARMGAAVRRIPTADPSLYTTPVTVDLGNDGVAPQVKFSAGGLAQAFTGPLVSSEVWQLDQCFLSTSVGQLDASQCIVYSGPLPLAQYAVTGSLAGGGSQFGLGGISVPNGWFIWGLWSGGVPGAVAYLRVTGSKTVMTA